MILGTVEFQKLNHFDIVRKFLLKKHQKLLQFLCQLWKCTKQTFNKIIIALLKTKSISLPCYKFDMKTFFDDKQLKFSSKIIFHPSIVEKTTFSIHPPAGMCRKYFFPSVNGVNRSIVHNVCVLCVNSSSRHRVFVYFCRTPCNNFSCFLVPKQRLSQPLACFPLPEIKIHSDVKNGERWKQFHVS